MGLNAGVGSGFDADTARALPRQVVTCGRHVGYVGMRAFLVGLGQGTGPFWDGQTIAVSPCLVSAIII